MNRRFGLIILSVLLLGANLSAMPGGGGAFLEDYFAGTEFTTDAYRVDGLEVNCSYLYADELRGIVSKAVVYRVRGKEILPLLMFDGTTVKTPAEVLFSAIPPKNKEYFGWKLNINGTSGGVSTSFYTEGGASVTEGPSFFWDKPAGEYKKQTLDRSKW